MAKDFLYMVQSEAALAEEHLKLNTARSDVLVFTWDRKIDRPGFLYQPNTQWGHGRQILLEAGRKLKHKYKYYVMMDDDVEFNKGNYKAFEDAVLQKKPDLCQPVYLSSPYVAEYARITPFRYSAFFHFDSAFMCFKRELFYDEKIYYLRGNFLDESHLRSFTASTLFWIRLFEWFSHLKLMVFNDFHLINTKHLKVYDTSNFVYIKIFKLAEKECPNFTNRYIKNIPVINANIITTVDFPKATFHWKRVIDRIAFKAKLPHDSSQYKASIRGEISRVRVLWKTKRYKLLRKYIMFRLRKGFLSSRIVVRLVMLYAKIGGLWRDLKLNLRLWREGRSQD